MRLVGRVSQSERIHALGFHASARRRERKLAFRIPIKLADAGDLAPHPSPNLTERPHTITDKTDGITFVGFVGSFMNRCPRARHRFDHTAERAREVRDELMELLC